MHYVIGDVHGHYNALMRLTARLPDHAKLTFVGDLIDRGPRSAEVVQFVREGGHGCVMGNHEHLMDTFGSSFSLAVEQDVFVHMENIWCSNGGIDTLKSYGLVTIEESKPILAPNAKEKLTQFKEDIHWMQQLPLFIVLDTEHASGKPVVISHAAVAAVWDLRHNNAMRKTFEETALWNRRDPDEDAEIFNIFGHTVTPYSAKVQPHFVNVDTGCYMARSGYGVLSAYCVETGGVVSVKR